MCVIPYVFFSRLAFSKCNQSSFTNQDPVWVFIHLKYLVLDCELSD